ncbi:MAG: HAMP domain-containing protein [Sphingomonadales bacterium]|nr:HAMP domain-containing protein [Sphingomonadales bacterium]MBU3991122.1 sensor N-terminal transmembrane domain-containing protein [Alphaproteobacteria bacterium]
MAQAIPLLKPEPFPDSAGKRAPGQLFWTRRFSLTARILAVNLIVLGLMGASVIYLDSYRKQLIAERFKLARSEGLIIADALAETPRSQRNPLLARIGSEQMLRLRLYDAKGRQIADSFLIADEPAFAFVDPGHEPWSLRAARGIDRAMDRLVGAPPVPDYVEPAIATADAWPEIREARTTGEAAVRLRSAPDRTPVITAAVPYGERAEILLTTRNARDIVDKVRAARQTLAIIIGIALVVSIQLSLFLARTIVQPLRLLARATMRVRAGREREVVVPRLPERGDEIGLLARAVSDMTTALRQRIDAVETFAADVAHEIKNPLASLRSAIESLDKVSDPELRRELTRIAAHDVKRIDRLVTEISDASRIDAELTRTTFEPVDMAALTEAIVRSRAKRAAPGHTPVSVRHGRLPCRVLGDPARLERVLVNLLDNAASFSPPGGTIELATDCADGRVQVSVTDDGPGIPAESREKVFERFHSLRPEEEDFGSHSGLGLAIARTIVTAHEGTLTAGDRHDGRPGARLVIDLPEAA